MFLDTAKVKESADAAMALVTMAQEMPNEGGLVSWFTGDNELDELGKQLAVFGYGLSSYSNSVAGVNCDKIKESADATLIIARMAQEIPNEGGIVSWFTGDNDLGGFGKGLSKYGSYLTEYSNYMASVSMENVRKGTECFKMISQMSTDVSTGDIRLGTFCEDVRDLGEALVDYSYNVSVVALKDTEAIVRNLNNVVDACNNLASVDTSAIRNVGDSVQDSIRDVVDGCLEVILAKLPDYVKMGRDMITRINTGITNESPSMIATATKAGGDLIQAFRNAIGSKVSTVEQSFKDLTTTVGKTLASATSNFSSVGADWMSKLKSGIDSGKSSVSTSMSGVCGGLAQTVRSYYDRMYNAGYYLVCGLANGISYNSNIASYAAAAVARSAAQAARNALDINSPSKVFEEIGKFVDMGLAQGISKYSNISDESAKTTAENAAENMREAISTILNEDLNDDIVIRPVLDLSEVQNGIGRMNSMMNGSISAARSTALASTISGRIGSPSSASMSNVSNNTNNTEIINHFNITGNNPQEIANEVSKIIQKQVERRGTVWA